MADLGRVTLERTADLLDLLGGRPSGRSNRSTQISNVALGKGTRDKET
jgi:hypothetical protein